MALLPKVKLKTLPTFPSTIYGGTGIDVTKANGALTVDLDYNDFGVISSIPTSPTSYILTYDTVSQAYVMVPSHLLGGGVSGIADAPNNGTVYARQSAAWVPLVPEGDMLQSVYDPTGKATDAFNAANESFIQAGTEAVVRTSQIKMREVFSIKDFGGVGDGSYDNTAAMNAALAALPSPGGCIYFPPGKYRFNSAITYNIPSGIFSVTLLGSGQDSTTLTWPSAFGGMTFNYTGANSSVHVRDLSLTTGVANGGTALTLNLSTNAPGGSALGAASDLYCVTMRGDDGYMATDYWSTGLNIANTAGIQIDNLTVMGSATSQGTGIIVAGLNNNSFSTLVDVAKSNFQGLATGIVYGSYVQGVTVDQTNFTFVVEGIVSLGSEQGALVQLAITNSQFNPGNAANGVGINTQTFIGGLQILNNFFVIGGPSQFGIIVGQAGHCQIAYNQLQGIGSTAGGGIAIGASVSGAPIIIGHNDFYGWGNGGGALWLQSTSANVLVTGNTFGANATNITNQGTNNTIIDNPGYNPVGASQIAVGASPFTYAAGASPETIYIRTAGTISNITLNNGSQQIASAAPGGTATMTIHLDRAESFTTTYAGGAPVMFKMVH